MKPDPLESPFAEKAVESALEVGQRKAWKNRAMMEGMGLNMPDMDDPARVHIAFSSACPHPAGTGLLYLLQTESAGGLFHHQVDQKEERRLFHQQHFFARDLACHPGTGWIACSLRSPKGTAALMLMNEDGSDRREVTGGDCIDAAPSWTPGPDYGLVYESAGIARGPEGYVAAVGPIAIFHLDLNTRKVESLLEDPACDFLSPRQRSDGSLLFIRRPYEPVKHHSFVNFALDVVLFPFRLMRAFVYFLNPFSMFFSQKPLITSTGAPMKREQQAGLMLRGRWVETKRAMRDGQASADAGVVPDSWQLVRRTPGGDETVLARGVLSYQPGADGALYYTNGRAIYRLREGALPERLLTHGLIEDFWPLR